MHLQLAHLNYWFAQLAVLVLLILLLIHADYAGIGIPIFKISTTAFHSNFLGRLKYLV